MTEFYRLNFSLVTMVTFPRRLPRNDCLYLGPPSPFKRIYLMGNILRYDMVANFPCSNSTFCGCYVAPNDSSYHSHHILAEIQGRCLQDNEKCIILGDLNSRCGDACNRLSKGSVMRYSGLQDNVSKPNANGESLLQLCQDCNLLLANNLQTPNCKITRSKDLSSEGAMDIRAGLLCCVDDFAATNTQL